MNFIEIIVSLFIFSFLLLGIDALQINSLHKTEGIYYFSTAVEQIDAMVERLESTRGIDQREQIEYWNKQNQKLLPQGRGEVTGSYPNYFLNLYWGSSSKQECIQNVIGKSGCAHFVIRL